MFLLSTIFLLLTPLGSVQAAPGVSSLERRVEVDDAVRLLVAAKASAFCSSVVGIKDFAITKTSLGPTSRITVTDAAAPCTSTAPANTLTDTSLVTLPAIVISATTTLVASTSTSVFTAPAPIVTVTSTLAGVTDMLSITLPVSTSTNTITVTPAPDTVTTTATSTSFTTTTITSYAQVGAAKKRSAAPTTCNLKDVPPVIKSFACDIIQKACEKYVQPNSQTTTKFIPVATYTSHTLAPASCVRITPPPSKIITTATITPAAVTSVATITPAASVVTSTITPPAVAVTTSTQLPASTTSLTVTPPVIVITSTITQPASTSTSTTTSVRTATSTVFFQGTITGINNCRAGRTPYDLRIPGVQAFISITCNGFGGNPFGSVGETTTNSLTDCVNSCLNNACDAVDWNILTGQCIKYSGAISGPVENYSFNHMQIDIVL